MKKLLSFIFIASTLTLFGGKDQNAPSLLALAKEKCTPVVVTQLKKNLATQSPNLKVCRIKTKFPIHKRMYIDKQDEGLISDIHNPVKTYVFCECPICREEPRYQPSLPCCHKKICKKCYEKIYDCPFCRKNLKPNPVIPSPTSIPTYAPSISELMQHLTLLHHLQELRQLDELNQQLDEALAELERSNH
jgi:hypothetical protein